MTSIITQNRVAIETALNDYYAHTRNDYGIFEQGMPSDTFIGKLAHDSAYAKQGLREMFRKADGWNEELQAVIINGTQTHDPDLDRIDDLIRQIIYPHTPAIYDKFGYDFISCACCYFHYEDPRQLHIDALKHFIGNKFRPDRKPSRLFQDFAKAIGVYDDKAGSQYQWLFAQLADEMNGRKLDFKLFLSINPAHILTASNPRFDDRGRCLVSCHTLDHNEYSYGCGNIGYARDGVTFIAFTVADPKNPELLNNRKTFRQFYFYKPNSGVLLQSRLYNTQGGTHGEQAQSKLYRDLVQRTISGAESAINLWETCNYDDGHNKFDIYFAKAQGFGGYADWKCYSGNTIKISVRKDCLESARGSSYIIGAPSLCVQCAEEIYNSSWFCHCCDTEHETCEECGCRVDRDCGSWFINQHGDEVFVCDTCLCNGYFYCEDCGEYHHDSDCHNVGTNFRERYVCTRCLEENYFKCDDCGEYHPLDERNCLWEGHTVCDDCLSRNYTKCEICGEYTPNDDVYFLETKDGEIKTCPSCALYAEEQPA